MGYRLGQYTYSHCITVCVCSTHLLQVNTVETCLAAVGLGEYNVRQAPVPKSSSAKTSSPVSYTVYVSFAQK